MRANQRVIAVVSYCCCCSCRGEVNPGVQMLGLKFIKLRVVLATKRCGMWFVQRHSFFAKHIGLDFRRNQYLGRKILVHVAVEEGKDRLFYAL